MMSAQGFQDLIGSTDGKNLHWTSDINFELPIKLSENGVGATIKPQTIPDAFSNTARIQGDKGALRVMRNNKEIVKSWKEYYEDCISFAKAMHSIGVEERKAVNIMGFNSPEWATCFFGAFFNNNVVSGVYTTNGAAACQY